MTINLTDLKAKAEAATPGEWTLDPHDVCVYCDGVEIADANHISEGQYIAAASPADTLPLINALIEWRDAWMAIGYGELLHDARLRDAHEALLTLIGGQP